MGISLWINLVGRPEGLPFLGLKAGFHGVGPPFHGIVYQNKGIRTRGIIPWTRCLLESIFCFTAF